MQNATDLLIDYARDHRDRRNIASHFVGVPLVVFAVAALLARARFGLAGHELSMAWVGVGLLATLYLARSGPLTLTLGSGTVVAALVALAHPMAEASTGRWLTWSLTLLALGMLVQWIGHVYEGKREAFVDDFATPSAGPLFVTAQVLFMLGWNRPLQDEMQRRAGPTVMRDLARIA
ncbi:MAG: Mpo1-like protein [Burkholderiaceae bacterium]